MARTLKIALILFFGVLGWFVAARLSSEAMAVVVGVVAGVLAGLPTALLLMVAMRRFNSNDRAAPPQPAYPQPPVIVVNGGGQPQAPALPQHDYSLFGAPERQWRSIGYDDRPRAPVIVGDEDDVPPAQTTTFAEVHPDLGESEPAASDNSLGRAVAQNKAAAGKPSFRLQEDVILDFVTDWCVQDGSWIGASELYETYCEYCANGDWQPTSQTKFGLVLGSLGVPKRRGANGGFVYGLTPDI